MAYVEYSRVAGLHTMSNVVLGDTSASFWRSSSIRGLNNSTCVFVCVEFRQIRLETRAGLKSYKRVGLDLH